MMVDSDSSPEVKSTLDCIGLYCPMPVLKTREEIDKLEPGDVLEMLADDPAAEEDMKAWAKRTGNKLLSVEKISDGIRFLFRKTE